VIKKASKISFWVTNISNRNVSLADLNVTIKAFSSVNLMDTKHYQYTLKQLEKSAKNGSLYKKKHFISVRKIEPIILKIDIPLLKETYLTSRERSVLEIREENYEELALSDEQFAAENSDLT
jgi:hypothetical protein